MVHKNFDFLFFFFFKVKHVKIVDEIFGESCVRFSRRSLKVLTTLIYLRFSRMPEEKTSDHNVFTLINWH